MTKEEILSNKPQYSRNSFGLPGDGTPEYTTINAAKLSMDEYAKQQAIKFSDFLLECDYEPSFSKKWIDFSRSGDNRLTSEDAYNKFIEQQNM